MAFNWTAPGAPVVTPRDAGRRRASLAHSSLLLERWADWGPLIGVPRRVSGQVRHILRAAIQVTRELP